MAVAATASKNTGPRVPAFSRHISVQDGLSQVTISDILQDKKGFMWFATQNGINRYDGYNFIQYKRDKNLSGDGPVGEFAYRLENDPASDDIWIASSGGISRYEYESDRFRHYGLTGQDDQPRLLTLTIVADKTGQIWAGTRQGLFRYDRDSDSFTSVPIAISASSWVLDIALDEGGELLVATTEGLLAIVPSAPGKAVHKLIGVNVTDIARLDSGDYWFATAESGVLRKRDGNPQLDGLTQIDSLDSDLVKSGVNGISQLANGDIWLSTNTGLVIVKEGDPMEVVNLTRNRTTENILSASHLTRTYQSRSGLIWQGTWTSGFSLFDPDNLQIKSLNVPPASWVRGLEKDNREQVWFGNPVGIWKRGVDGVVSGPWTLSGDGEDSNAASRSYIRSLAFDEQRDLFWVGTTAGLYRFPASAPAAEKLEILPDATIFHMDTDAQGYLWVGTYNEGLFLFDPDTFEVKGHWPVATVTHIYLGRENEVIVGTIEGLMLIDRQTRKLTNLSEPGRSLEQQSPRVVTWISRTRNNDDHYWLGTRGEGVFSMDMSESVIHFSAVQPGSHLATLSVGGVQEDSRGNLWASTTEGIAKVDQLAGQVTYYNKKNGAYSEGYYINHSIQTSQGEILFAGPKGISHFFPDDIGLSTWEPELVLTNLLVLNRPVASGNDESTTPYLDKPIHIANKVRLGPNDNVFSVEFSALDYAAPHNNQYAFMLEGFDPDWNHAIARQRVATYTNLDPGEYMLKVKGTNKDQVWSDKIATLKVIVEPPWYWTHWAQLLWFLLVAGTVTLLYRWRIWSLELRSKELRRLVEQRTRDLEASNAKLRKLSSIDELTGLRNRRDFRVHAENEIARYKRTGSPFSILMMDIDHFKRINDQKGHAYGDTVLIEAAQVMTQLIRQQDLLARWGGEEFIILAANTGLSDAVTMAEKIRDSLERHQFEVEGDVVSITVTIGVSEIHPHQSLDDCINKADERLYIGKRNGRNQVTH